MSHVFRIGSGICASIVGGTALVNITQRYTDTVEGKDPFSLHTAEQQKKHFLSGMHEAYFPNTEQRKFVETHFPQFSYLLADREKFEKEQFVETTVKIKSLWDCPLYPGLVNCRGKHNTVVVGGPPALVSSANEKVTYICDGRQRPIFWGSALHGEWDGESEAPTSYLPSQFMAAQIYRALLGYGSNSLKNAEKTGQFSWRSLDWAGWIKRPSSWAEGIQIALTFQKTVKSKERQPVLQEVAERCKENQAFCEQLNQDLGGKLFLPGRGSIIVARNEEEKKALEDMKKGLTLEGRELIFLSKEEMQERYGFVPPEGIAFAEKTHDAVFSPDFMKLIAGRIKALGGKTINGCLTTVYTDNFEEGGIVEYACGGKCKHYVPFSKLVLSLGTQRILGKDDKPLFKAVTASGISVLAVAYVPKGRTLPPVMVCGGTNHATKLSEPVSVQGADGNFYDAYLMRMTAAACITPNAHGKESTNYDGVAATGLVASVRKTLDCELDVVTVYGCKRQVSEHGQSHWGTISSKHQYQDLGTHRSSSASIQIQMGAGGGGLTQGPARPPKESGENRS